MVGKFSAKHIESFKELLAIELNREWNNRNSLFIYSYRWMRTESMAKWSRKPPSFRRSEFVLLTFAANEENVATYTNDWQIICHLTTCQWRESNFYTNWIKISLKCNKCKVFRPFFWSIFLCSCFGAVFAIYLLQRLLFFFHLKCVWAMSRASQTCYRLSEFHWEWHCLLL